MSNNSKPKILIIFGDAAETVDTMYPYFRLIEGGYESVLAAPEKRDYQMVMHLVKPGWTITREWEGYVMSADIIFKDIKPGDMWVFFSVAGVHLSIFVKMKIYCESLGISLMKTLRLLVFVMVSRFRPVRVECVVGVWLSCPSVNLIWRSVEVSLWMNPVSSMAIWSAVGLSGIMVTTFDHGCHYSTRFATKSNSLIDNINRLRA
jgi:hypothetical protein